MDQLQRLVDNVHLFVDVVIGSVKENSDNKESGLLLFNGKKRTVFCYDKDKDFYIELLEDFAEQERTNDELGEYFVDANGTIYEYVGYHMWKVKEIENESL